MRRLTVAVERFPIAGAFTISRGSRTEAVVVAARITDEARGVAGWGECVPYPRYGESVESVAALIEEQADAIGAGLTRAELMARMQAGRRAQRPRLRAARSRGQGAGSPRLGDPGADAAASGHHRLYAEPRHAREHGGGRAQGVAAGRC